MEEENIPEVKVVMFGDTNVGKTTIVRTFQTGKYDPAQHNTLGLGSSCHLVSLEDGRKLQLNIWDTAGQEQYRSMAPMYARDAKASLLVYDVTSRDSFNELENWIEILDDNSVPFILLGNKQDLDDRREVQTDEGIEFASKHNVQFFETSALSGYNINATFYELALLGIDENAYDRQKNGDAEPSAESRGKTVKPKSESVKISNEQSEPKKNDRCCA